MAAASLSAGTFTPTGKDTATLAVTSDQATGTVYAVITESGTAPSHAQIVAGNDNSGNPALWSGSKAGALSNSISATSVKRTNAKVYAHFTQTNGAAENSTPVSSAQGWFHDIGFGTMTTNATSSVVNVGPYPFIRCSGTFGSGTITFYYQDAGGNWVALDTAAFTSADQKVVQFHRASTLKAVLTGSTSPTLAWEIR